jgi:hypothetical protein
VAHSQIAAFARLAELGAGPVRTIEGQKTLLARTIHSMEYNAVTDEIVVPNPLSQAILTFRGASQGEEAPVRVIQGPLTQLRYPDKLSLDEVNQEIYVPQMDRILVFDGKATGNVAPIRVLHGPNTLLTSRGVKSNQEIAVDPVNNLLLVSGRGRGPAGGIIIFDRTANGDAKPKGIIGSGNGGSRHIFASPAKREIIVIGGDDTDTGTYVNVWKIDDRGEVAPRRWRLGMPDGPKYQAFRQHAELLGTAQSPGNTAALDIKNKSIILGSKALNAVLTYSFPEIF